jgi:small conductance mechanosensitive channel
MRFLSSLFFLLILGAQTASAASITDQGTETTSQVTSGLTSFFDMLWSKAPAWIAAMIVFACSLWVARIMKEKVVDKVSAKFAEDDQDILILIGRTTYVAVLCVGATIALSIAGIDLTAIIAAIGFGFGFAMQDLVANFVAGILILLNRPFSIGDFIQVNSTVGKVEEIQSRATILKALDGTKVIVPNADLFKNQVTSFTSNPFRRIDIDVGVDYRTDLPHASRVILEALRAHQKVLQDPPPAILLDSFGDSSVDFIARFWVESRSPFLKIKSEVTHLIKQHLDAAGIEMPFNTQNLVFDRENEGVFLPTYPVSQEEMKEQAKRRATQEAQLSEQVAASDDRVSKMVFANDIVLHAEGETKKEEVVIDTAPALVLQEETVPVSSNAPIPVGDRENGANFLRAAP